MRQTSWADAALVLMITALLQWGGAAFYLDKTDLGYGLLTGHWVHLNLNHYVLDVGTLMMLLYLLRPSRGVFWLGSLLISLLISACLIGFDQLDSAGIVRYAGLSGVLHGFCVLAAGARLMQPKLTTTDRWIAWILLLGALIKVVAERFGLGVTGSTEQVIGAPVVGIAHFDGAILGLLLLMGYWAAMSLIEKGALNRDRF